MYRACVPVLVLLLLLGQALGNGLPSVGVAGPSQVMTIPTGENTTSYIRVYNDGNATGTYGLEVQGNASSITVLAVDRVSIPPGENTRVEITYVAPVEESYYEGVLVVSLEGEQIVPGVTKEIAVTLEKPAGNRAPRVSLVFPEGNVTLSGDVDVEVWVEDPDGDSVGVSVYIDGEKVSDKGTYVWRTRRWEDGEHELRIVATDGKGESEVVERFMVSNPGGFPAPYAAFAAGACVALLGLVIRYRKRR